MQRALSKAAVFSSFTEPISQESSHRPTSPSLFHAIIIIIVSSIHFSSSTRAASVHATCYLSHFGSSGFNASTLLGSQHLNTHTTIQSYIPEGPSHVPPSNRLPTLSTLYTYHSAEREKRVSARGLISMRLASHDIVHGNRSLWRRSPPIRYDHIDVSSKGIYEALISYPARQRRSSAWIYRKVG